MNLLAAQNFSHSFIQTATRAAKTRNYGTGNRKNNENYNEIKPPIKMTFEVTNWLINENVYIVITILDNRSTIFINDTWFIKFCLGSLN